MPNTKYKSNYNNACVNKKYCLHLIQVIAQPMARKASQMRHKAALKAKPTDVVKDTLDELDYYRPASIKSVPEVPSSLATKILGTP